MEASADWMAEHETYYGKRGRPSPVSPLTVVTSDACEATGNRLGSCKQSRIGIETVLANLARSTTSCDLALQLQPVCVCVCVAMLPYSIIQLWLNGAG